MNGLAAAIFVASAAMLLGGGGLFWFAGRQIADVAGWAGTRRRFATSAGAAIGAGIGALAIAATFFETSWAPPPTLHFIVPSRFKPSWVILLEDRTRGRPLDWQGTDLPFLGRSATIIVPAGGVARVTSLADLSGNGDVRATWSDGATMAGFTGGRAPAASGATRFVAYQRQHGAGYDPRDELPVGDEAKFTEYLSKTER